MQFHVIFKANYAVSKGANIDKQTTVAELKGFMFKNKIKQLFIFEHKEYLLVYIKLSKDCWISYLVGSTLEVLFTPTVWQEYAHVQFSHHLN